MKIRLEQLQKHEAFKSILDHINNEDFEKAKNLAQKLEPRFQLTTLREIQQQNISSGKFSDAVLNLPSSSLDFTDSVISYLFGELLFFNGVAKFNNREIDSAIYYHERALEHRIRYQSNLPEKLAQSHGYLGYLYRSRKNNLNKAQEHYEHQYSILTSNNYQDEALAQTCYNLSVTYGLIEDFDLALTFAFKALSLSEKLKMDTPFKGYCLTSIANNYQLLQQYSLASNYYKKTIKLIESKFGENHPNLIILLNNLGVSLQEINEVDSARAYLLRALNLSEKIYGNNHLEIANCLMRLALVDLNRNSGKDWILRAIRLYQSSPFKNTKDLALAYTRLGRWFTRHHQSDSALFYFNKAIWNRGSLNYEFPTVPQTTTNHHFFTALKFRARLIKGQCIKHPENESYHLRAIKHYIFLDSCLGFHLSQLSRDNSRLQFFKRYQEVYEGGLFIAYKLIHSFKKSGYNHLFWKFTEKNKASILRESLNRLQAQNNLSIPNAIGLKEAELQSRYEGLRKTFESANETEKKEIQKKLILLQEEFDSLISYLQSKHPAYYQYKYQESLSLDAVKDHIQGKNISFVQFFEGNTYLFGMHVLGDTCFSLMLKKEAINVPLKKFLKLLSTGFVYSTRQNDFDSFCMLGSTLYTQLLDSLHIDKSANQLIISPDGKLNFLPFESLLTQEVPAQTVNYSALPYFLKTKDIGYAYSASTFFQKTGSLSLKLANIKSFVADPSSLPGAEKESSLIKDVLPHLQEFKREYSTKDKFLRIASETDIIHIVHHNSIDSGSYATSGLIFNGSDSLLQWHELYNLPLSTQMIALSACESGYGQYRENEGVYSMGRGFQYAGVPTIVMSLWKVADASSPQLMQQFYHGLKKRQNTAQSLSYAKKAYLDQADRFTAHPSNWAAFIHIGLIQKSNSSLLTYILIGLAILILTGAVFLKRKSFSNYTER